MKKETRLFKALADVTRLRILCLLLAGELCVCEIMAALDLPQSTVSRHLAYLRHAEWVMDRRQGVWMYYRLNQEEYLLQKDLLRVLKNHLSENGEVRADQERLGSFQERRAGQRC